MTAQEDHAYIKFIIAERSEAHAHTKQRPNKERKDTRKTGKTIVQAAADNDVVLEIDAHPERLDLNDDMILRAKEYKVKFSIDTDAHSPAGLDCMKYGAGQARRGWLEKKDVVNTLPFSRLKKTFKKI